VLVAVISDTHLPRGSRRLPESCIEQLSRADAIIHAGDLSTASFLDELRALGPPVHAVYGNADEPALREILAKELVVEAGGSRIGVVHIPGPRVRREQRLVARFPRCDAIVYGHTHLPQVDRHDDTWILNPGSPTERRGAPTHTMLLLEIALGGAIEPEIVVL
jgi:putative phosphoesterase